MTLETRLGRLEDGLHATVLRLTSEVTATLKRERSIPERRAFCRVADRVLALRRAGLPCPGLPTDRDVIAEGDGVRLPGGAVLATVEEWALYRRVAVRAVELWKEIDGPEIGFDTEAD